MGSKTATYDWTVTTQCHTIKINYLGYGENEIQVQLEEARGLGVHAKCKEEEENTKDLSVINSEREAKRNFWKIISVLEDDVEVNEIKASMDNGILTIVEPKKLSSSKKDATPWPKPSLHMEEIGDWKEHADSYIFKMNVQGYTRDELDVIVQEGTYLMVNEKRSGNIINIFTMSDDIKKDELKSSMENGVLTINVPKDTSQPPSKHSTMTEVPIKVN